MKELSKTICCPDCLHMIRVKPPNDINTICKEKKGEGSILKMMHCFRCGEHFQRYWIEPSHRRSLVK